jgi:hypothetical protein
MWHYIAAIIVFMILAALLTWLWLKKKELHGLLKFG